MVVKMHVFMRFISSLAPVLQEHGHQVRICTGDVDLTIIETALKIANHGSHATVVAYDTHTSWSCCSVSGDMSWQTYQFGMKQREA